MTIVDATLDKAFHKHWRPQRKCRRPKRYKIIKIASHPNGLPGAFKKAMGVTVIVPLRIDEKRISSCSYKQIGKVYWYAGLC